MGMRLIVVGVGMALLAGTLVGCGRSSRLRRMQEENAWLQERIRELEREPRTPSPGGKLDGGIEIVALQGGMWRMDIPGDVLFKAGSADLREKAKRSLLTAVQTIRKEYPGYHVRVAGHTDSDPVVKARLRYPTNWELSATRAITVLKFLVGPGGLDEANTSVVAWGKNNPRVSNATTAGKAKNRRVELYLTPGKVGVSRGSVGGK